MYIRDDHGNGIPIPIGNPTEIPWGLELMTQFGMDWKGMGINLYGNGNGNAPYSHGNKFPSEFLVVVLVVVGYKNML